MREIARAFNLKNDRRAELKRVLRELAGEGSVESRRSKLHHPGALPSVTLADITARDADGELIAVPTEWDEDEHGRPPKIRILMRRARPGETAGVGDRALLRVEESGDEDVALQRPRHQDHRPRQGARARHLSRAAGRRRTAGAGRQEAARQGTRHPARRRRKDAQDGDLIAVSVQRQGRFGLPIARVEEKLGSLKSERAVSLIAIHAHEIPHVFPQAVLDEAEAAKPADLAGREDWRKLAARHHRSGRRQGSRRRGPRRARSRPGQSRRPHHHASPSPTSRITCGRAPRSTARRSSAATRSIFPTAWCRCCRSASPTICARCAPARTARRWRCA